VIAAVVFASTFVPKGAFSLNPTMINNADLKGEVDTEHEGQDPERGDDSSDEKTEKPAMSTDIGAMIG
jgi:hypothetical protein